MENMTRKVEQMIRRNAKRKLWRRAVSIPAAIVVFVTTYALILPAIAMERDTFCGQEEHRHDESCYTDQLICGYEEGQWINGPTRVWELDCHALDSVHQHTKECYDDQGNQICRYADYLAHEHNADCYDASGALICPLPENKVHTHTAECYVQEQVLSCGQAESAGHTHTAECYTVTETRTLTCGQEEYPGHTHTAECYNTYNNTYLACGQEEYAGHTHTESCYAPVYGEDGTTVVGMDLVCGQAESAGHTHTDACYATETISELICGQEEYPGHTHTDACYTVTQEQTLTCGQEEHPGHTHTDACYTTENRLVCDKPEIILHTHYNDNSENDCYDEDGNLICTQLEVNEHVHSEACFAEREVAPAQEHHHTEVCYQHTLICGMEEHIHTLLCYADPNATPVPSVEETAAPAPDQTQPGTEPTPVGEAEPSVSKGPVFMFDPNASEDEAAEPTEDVEPSVSVEPTEDVKPSVSVEPTEDVEPSVSVEPTEDVEPSVSVEPTEEIELSEDVEPTEDAEPSESPEPTATLKPVGGMADDGPSFEGAMTPTPKATATTEPTATPEPVLVCTLAEHTHDEDCYDEDGELICELAEHEHTDDCYAIPEPTATTEPTATPEPVLICTLTEHTHDEDCYDEDGELICELAEHEHTEDCYATPVRATSTPESTATPEPTAEPTPAPTPVPTVEVTVLICGQEEHEHTAECMLDGEYICGKNIHTHTEDCYATVMMELLCGQTEHEHNEECYDEAGELICGLEEHTHTEDCLGEIVQTEDEYGIMTMDLPEGDEEIMGIAETGDGFTRLNKYVTGVSGENPFYDPSTGEYSTKLTVDFTIPNNDIKENPNFSFDLPAGSIVPPSLLDKWRDGHDNNNGKPFRYRYVKDGDTYRVEIKFYPDYVESLVNGENFDGYFSFSGYKLKITDTSEKQVDFKIGQTEEGYLDLDWKNTTIPYDYSLRKELVSQSEQEKKDGIFHYRVVVYSKYGTKEDIDLDDYLTIPDGAQITSGPDSITIKEFDCDENGNLNGEGREVTGATYNSTDRKLHVDLPKLEVKPNQPKAYVVEYTYHVDLNNVDIEKFSVKNNAVTVSDKLKKEASHSVDYDRTVLEKTGVQESERIKWTITVNKGGQNITGWTLTDEMFNSNQVKLEDLKIYDSNGNALSLEQFEIETKNVDGVDYVTSIKFKDGVEDHNQYTVEYYTNIPENGYNKHYYNTAHLTEAGPGAEHTKDSDVWVNEKTPPQIAGAKWQEDKNVNRDATLAGDNNEYKQVPWHIWVGIWSGDFIPAGTESVDHLLGPDGKVNGDLHWMTVEQVKFLLSWREPTETDSREYFKKIEFIFFVWEDGKEINMDEEEYLEYVAKHPDARVVGFKFHLIDDIDKSDLPSDSGFTLYYYSTIYREVEGEYPNTLTNNAEGNRDKWTYFNPGDTVEKTDGNDKGDKSELTIGYDEYTKEPTLTWKVKVHREYDHTSMDVVDTLPQGVTLKSVSYSYTEDSSKYTWVNDGSSQSFTTKKEDSEVYGATGTYENGAVTLNFKEPQLTEDWMKNRDIVITYVCTLSETDKAWFEAHAYDFEDALPMKAYTNHVSVTFESGKTLEDDQTQEVKVDTVEPVVEETIVGKSGTYDGDEHVATYSVDVNPTGHVIYDAGDILTLTDTLSYKKYPAGKNDWGGRMFELSMDLVFSSVKLYYAETVNGELQRDENGHLVPDKSQPVPDGLWSWEYSESYELANQWDSASGVYTKVITAKVPNTDQPMVLTYEYKSTVDYKGDYYKVNDWDGEIDDSNKPGFVVTNIAEMFGRRTVPDNKTWYSEKEETDAGGASKVHSGYNLVKIEKGKYSTTLEDAKFELHMINPDTGTDYVWTGAAFAEAIENVGFKFATNSVGRINMNLTTDVDEEQTLTILQDNAEGKEDEIEVPFDMDTIYYWVEIEAPNGYKIQDGDAKYYFWYNDGADLSSVKGYEDAIKVDGRLKDLHANTNNTVIVENEKSETYTLPETGGIGTLVYTLGGLAMLSLAGALVCDRRRRRTSKGGGAD